MTVAAILTQTGLRRAERHNADMRLWMRLLLWATRNCADAGL